MKLKRIIASVMIMATTFSLAACGTNTSSNKVPGDDRTTIRVSMFNDASYTNWRAYVQEQCPEINIVWENNRNSFDNLLYMAEHDDMADIVSIRKFTSDGAKSLSPYLADLKGNAMTDTFAEGSLSFFTYDDKVNWYPESGMIASLYVNKSLLDSLGIAVPTTRAELEEACTKMAEQGYYGLTSDFSAGYHATATLEGFGAQYFFETEAGNAWREAYQDGTVHTADTETFTQVGDALTSLVQNNVITQPMWQLAGTGRETAFD
ncbi:MAG: ABC transporter substrate-binding protein, partial [Hespellia sp.]|nr:ABC transporter substrate-binding protein [Hespellia sp.]